MRKSLLFFAGLSLLTSIGCGRSQESSVEQVNLISLSKEEALEDLDAISKAVTRLYGPLEFKEKRFNYKVSDLLSKAREEIEKGEGEADYAGVFVRLLASLEDGHVSIKFPGNASKVRKYRTGVLLTPVEGKAVVAKVEDVAKGLGVAVGDIVVMVDGKDPSEYLETIKKYKAFGNDVSDLHHIQSILSRDFYMKELLPSKPFVRLEVEKAEGEKLEIELPWIKDNEPVADAEVLATGVNYVMQVAGVNEFNREAKGSLAEFGARQPFFASEQVGEKFSVVEVEPNEAFLKKYDLKKEEVYHEGKFVFYAALYTYAEKTILLVRQAGYMPPIDSKKMVNAYKALLDQYDSFADVLVIDQNHNPGGSLGYVTPFFQLLIPKGKSAANLVQHSNIDRKWYYDLLLWADEEKEDIAASTVYKQRAGYIEAGLDQGLTISSPFPLLLSNMLQGDKDYVWKKPVLVLADELAGSCGDIFPMLVKRNGIGKVFGKRTMGLGGNVEVVVTLPNSRADVRVTRGLFTSFKADSSYDDSDLVENNGITPDLEYNHTVSDFRAGFVGYFEEMSKAAIAQIK